MKNKALKNTRILTLLSLCAAISVVLRLTLNFIPNFQPMSVIIIFIGLIMGPVLGTINAALSVFLSNLILGSGLWTIQQVFTYISIVLLGCLLKFILEKNNVTKKTSYIFLLVFSGLSGFFYGFIISISDVLIFKIPSFFTYYFAGLYFDGLHALGNMIFFIVLYPTLYKIIESNYKKIINS